MATVEDLRTQLQNEGIFLTKEGLQYCIDEAKTQNVDKIRKQLLDIDLKEIGDKIIPDDINRSQKAKFPKGPILLQILSVKNVAQTEDRQDNLPCVLYVVLSDGHTPIKAVQLGTETSTISTSTPPGTKVLFKETKFSNGFLMLDKELEKNMVILGGNVEELIESWKIERKNMDRYRRQGITSDTDGPPKFTPLEQQQPKTQETRSGPQEARQSKPQEPRQQKPKQPNKPPKVKAQESARPKQEQPKQSSEYKEKERPRQRQPQQHPEKTHYQEKPFKEERSQSSYQHYPEKTHYQEKPFKEERSQTSYQQQLQQQYQHSQQYHQLHQDHQQQQQQQYQQPQQPPQQQQQYQQKQQPQQQPQQQYQQKQQYQQPQQYQAQEPKQRQQPRQQYQQKQKQSYEYSQGNEGNRKQGQPQHYEVKVDTAVPALERKEGSTGKLSYEEQQRLREQMQAKKQQQYELQKQAHQGRTHLYQPKQAKE